MEVNITNDQQARDLFDQIKNGTLVGEERDQKILILKDYTDARRRSVENTPEERLNFAQRFGEDLKKRRVMFEDIREATTLGEDGKIEQGYPEAILQTIGKVGVCH